MKKFLLLSGFIIASTLSSKAQNHGSCDKAAFVDTNSYGPVYADGKPDELLAMPHTDGTYFEKPHVAVWFCIDIPYDTVLTFDLIPQTPTDDLDFLLFKDETAEIKNCGLCRVDKKNFCQRIAVEKVMPVRSNIAHANMSIKGMTGLSTNAQNEFEAPGKHSTYCREIEVKKGERYYLVVDNYTAAQRPFTLKLHLRFPAEQTDIITATIKTPDSILERNTLPPRPSADIFKIHILDSLTGKPIKSGLKIEWVGGTRKLDTVASEYSFLPETGEELMIRCNAKGYLLAQKAYSIKPDSDKGIDIKLIPIKAHMKMVFKHIEFEPGEAKFLPKAGESLNDLLDFMMNNPDVKILIKGYVNDPLKDNSADNDMTLSRHRAEAVFNFLVHNGISKSRMQWKGYGNKEMVYTAPVNEDEKESNRRVEVEIMK